MFQGVVNSCPFFIKKYFVYLQYGTYKQSRTSRQGLGTTTRKQVVKKTIKHSKRNILCQRQTVTFTTSCLSYSRK